MNDGDNRHITRDSLFILAKMRLDSPRAEHIVKVRNLSAGGMMGESNTPVARGDRIRINLRNVGWIGGLVAWVQGDRFGVAFSAEIDVKLVRAHHPSASSPNEYFRRRLMTGLPHMPSGPVRKIF